MDQEKIDPVLKAKFIAALAANTAARESVNDADELSDAEIDEILAEHAGAGPLEQRMRVTFFPDTFAKSKDVQWLSLRDLASVIRAESRTVTDLVSDPDERASEAKMRLPYLKLAPFGREKSPLGCYRTNANMGDIYGIEVEHDGKPFPVPYGQALKMARAAGVACLIYTTPSHRPGKERWRALFALSGKMSKKLRQGFVAIANGIFGGCLAPESARMSQGFLYGAVNGSAHHRVDLIDGQFIDQLPELASKAIGFGTETTRPAAEASREGAGASLADPVDEDAEKARIASGDNYHDATLRLAGHYAVKGVPFDKALKTIKTQYTKVPDASRDARWRDRFGEVKRTVWTIYEAEISKRATAAQSESQRGVADAFVRKHGSDFRFDHTSEQWKHFTPDRQWHDENTRLASQHIHDIAFLTNPASSMLSTASFAAGAETLVRIRREIVVLPEQFDTNHNLLGAPGVTIELENGKMRDASASDYISKVIRAAPIPLDRFRPERDCPTWIKHLDSCLPGRPEAIDSLQRYFGYMLTGHTREQVAYILSGEGRNGKGVIKDTLIHVMGGYAYTAPMTLFMQSKVERHSQGVARLNGPRAVFASESDKHHAFNIVLLKELIGEDPITARLLYQNDSTFAFIAKLLFTLNYRPQLGDVDTAIRERLRNVEFREQFTFEKGNRDNTLREKLKLESAGIASWLLVGCRDWYRDGLTYPSDIKATTDSYMDENDLGPVFAKSLERTSDSSDFATIGAIWIAWHEFLAARGATGSHGTRYSKNRTFPELLTKHTGIESIKRGGVSGLVGIKIPSDSDENDDNDL